MDNDKDEDFIEKIMDEELEKEIVKKLLNSELNYLETLGLLEHIKQEMMRILYNKLENAAK